MEEEQIQPKKTNKMVLIIIAIITVIAVLIAVYFLTQDNEETTNTNTTPITNTTSTTNTVANANTDLYADLMQYDNNIIGIASIDGKVTGLAAISIDITQTMPIAVVYFLKVDDSLPKSVAANMGASASYYYIANHTTADAINEGNGTGVLSEAFCNPDEMPDILALAQEHSINLELYRGCDAQYDVYHTTETFYHLYIEYYNNYDFDYDTIIGKDTLAVFDTAPYYVADATTGGYNADAATVISQADPTVTYDLVYSD